MPVDPRDAGSANPSEGIPPETQKRVLWFVLGIGVIALVLGGMQLQHSLTNPFHPTLLASANTNGNNASIEALKAKDTDKDGLSDYDELYVYHTSPYIADSDSDGVSDGQEVKNGTDPNCPDNITGHPCGIIDSNSNSNSSSNTNAVASNANSGLSVDNQALATQIRQALLAAGVPQSQIDGVDDATLIQQYQSVLADTNTNSDVNATNTPTNTNTANANVPNANLNGVTSPDQLSSLSASQIRLLLEANGVPQSTLDAYDDATVTAIYLNALQQANSNSNTNA